MLASKQIAFGKAAGGGLPDGVIPVEYLENEKGCYIDTTISVDPNTRYVISGKARLVSAKENYVVGQSILIANTACAGLYNNNNSIRLAYRTNNASSNDISSIISSVCDFRADYAPNSQTLTFGSVTLTASQVSIIEGGGVISLFRRGSRYAETGNRLYGVKISKDNVLVANFIPVLDNDLVPCMYDEVSGEFFYNQGTGEFIAGPEI